MDESVLFHWSYDDRLMLAIEYARMLRESGETINGWERIDMLAVSYMFVLNEAEHVRMSVDLAEEL